MAINIPYGVKPEEDEILRGIVAGFEAYQKDNPASVIDAYRLQEFIIRARVIDESFAGLNRSQRQRKVWKYLENIPEETISDLATVVCITPQERADSIANFDFERPRPRALALT